jgi:hypothetical protein
MSYREDKLQIQREADSSNGDDGNLILKGVKVYINGYLEGTTDTEIKKVIVQCGGRVVCVASKLESSMVILILCQQWCRVAVHPHSHIQGFEWIQNPQNLDGQKLQSIRCETGMDL